MEKGYAASGSERPLSEGVASANAPHTPAHQSLNMPARESRATNGIEAGSAVRAEIPAGVEYEHEVGRSRSNLFLLVTFGLALIGWLVTLVSQAVVAATISNSTVRILWFGFIIQTFVTFLVFEVIAGITTAYDYGVQIGILTSLATGFAVLGVDRNIYSNEAAQQATGAGWLIVSIVDLLWILYFTSPPHSPLIHLVTSSGGPRPPRPSPVTKISRSTDAFAMGALHGGSVRGSQGPSVPLENQKPVTASGHWSGTAGRNTVGSIPGTNDGKEGSAAGEPPASAHLSPPTAGPDQRASQAASSLPDADAKWRAEALFDYKGSNTDPNELAFKKGDTLLIYDTSSKWWEAKTHDGKKGIAPSNYLRLL